MGTSGNGIDTLFSIVWGKGGRGNGRTEEDPLWIVGGPSGFPSGGGEGEGT